MVVGKSRHLFLSSWAQLDAAMSGWPLLTAEVCEREVIGRSWEDVAV